MVWESELVRALHRLVRTPPDDPADGWLQAHSAFHHALVAGAVRPVLLATLTALSEKVRRYRALLGLRGIGQPLNEEIAAAATHRDAETAVARLRDDLEQERLLVLARLSRS